MVIASMATWCQLPHDACSQSRGCAVNLYCTAHYVISMSRAFLSRLVAAMLCLSCMACVAVTFQNFYTYVPGGNIHCEPLFNNLLPSFCCPSGAPTQAPHSASSSTLPNQDTQCTCLIYMVTATAMQTVSHTHFSPLKYSNNIPAF